MITITVSTKHLYAAWVQSFLECPDTIDDHTFGKKARGIATGNMEIIRYMFKDGYTMMLMGSRMGEIDFPGSENLEMEIRVYHGNPLKLIGVIIESEIRY